MAASGFQQGDDVTSQQSPCLLRRLLPGVLSAVLLLTVGAVCTGALYRVMAAALDRYDYPPPGRLVSVGVLKMHMGGQAAGSSHGKIRP